MSRTVIIGGGQAAAQACQSLRQLGYEGGVTLIGAESALPYHRPPLSKAFMKGDLTKDRLYIRQNNWYQENNIELNLGISAERIDRERKIVVSENGQILEYDDLIIATGSRPRPLPVPGSDLKAIFNLRTLNDVEHIREEIKSARRLLIVGGGYIGLEAAAVGRTLGLQVTLIESADRVLKRVTSSLISQFFEHQHRAKGVTIHTGVRLDHFEGRNGRVCAAQLADGRTLECDIVLIGVGILPNTHLAEAAGLKVDDGIVVDESARTSDPHIYACGDCALRPLRPLSRHGRLESVHNAIEQGKLAAAAIAGAPPPAIDCPWFWSDQYDLKLQIAGLSWEFDQLVVRGSPADRRFAAFYLKSGSLIAVDAVNSPAEFLASKKMIACAARPDPSALSDLSVTMRNIAAEAKR